MNNDNKVGISKFIYIDLSSIKLSYQLTAYIAQQFNVEYSGQFWTYSQDSTGNKYIFWCWDRFNPL